MTALFAAGLALASGSVLAQQLSINDVTVTEGQAATFTVTLTRPNNFNRRVRVDFATRNGSAVSGSDYTATSGRLEFPNGVTTRTITVQTIDNAVAEPTETFSVVLSNPDRASIADATGIGTIQDNDVAPQPTLSINDVTVSEGADAVFTVTLSASPASTVTVNFATANGTTQGASDFIATSGTLSFAAGTAQLTQTITVRTVNDSIAEGTEAFTVNLSGAANATIADAQGVGTITDNDAVPSLSVNDVSVTEGQTANFVVALSSSPAQPVTVTVATGGGSATAGVDYTAVAPRTLTFAAGTTALTQTVAVPTINDTAVEGNETFNLNLSNAVGAVIADGQGVATIVDNDQPPPPNLSINSTSQSCGGSGQPPCASTPVPQQPAPGTAAAGNSTFRVFAVNDLGMHCGDLDTRVASILPPFNVLRAQVFQQPATGRIPTRNPAGVSVNYSAASNPNDPALTATNLLSSITSRGGVYKTNFWERAIATFDPFYPPPPQNPFQTPFNLSMNPDVGLPVPDIERLYIDGLGLAFDQQAMPGGANPYVANAPQNFLLNVATMPFFTSFPFGYRSNVNWLTAEGVPISAFDDFGRENAYPLMRVQARNAQGAIVATTDTVMPISAEADCQVCHGAPSDGGNGSATTAVGIADPVSSFDDPQLGNVPLSASIEWAADNNILTLHDTRHGTQLVAQVAGGRPVVCQTCHYTPALDLAQVGPSDANGRQQTNNKTMSNVMHRHHGALTNLFPAMPAPIQNATTGAIDNQEQRLAVVDQTCYRCHPGDRNRCLRGAMFNGGMLCQDCHGDMLQVGNDFSRNLPGGQFIVAGDFYTNPNTPRVPWANEPGCGSCHTGDFAGGNLAGTAGTIVNLRDVSGNADNIRLLRAFRTGDAKATPIVPTNKRFAENVVTTAENAAAAGNPKLYRVSVDNHGAANGGGAGIFCEACHGATHAEWPNANPNANDNVTAQQLQGHTGTIIECATCHGTSLNGSLGRTLDGPHGMHPVGNDTSVTTGTAAGPLVDFVDGGHSNMTGNNACVACHGANATAGGRGQNTGTVLSVAKKDRRLNGQLIPKGTPIGCTICH